MLADPSCPRCLLDGVPAPTGKDRPLLEVRDERPAALVDLPDNQLTVGPMLEGGSLAAIKGHIQAVIQTRGSEGDSKLSLLEFPVHNGAVDGMGCDWHPSRKTNAKMAALLTAELKTRLGW